MLWSDLEPERGIFAALDYAGTQPTNGSQNEKRGWSEKFANGCAIALADEFREASEQKSSPLKGKRILPESLAAGTEPLTPLGAGTSKRIDVTVTDRVLGLEVGASLKGLNFVDSGSGNYDKNLTGRLYEMADEVRLVHEHLPHAFMVGIFFLPLASCSDKTDRGNSSFANTVVKLRARTGRLDAALAAHASRCDAAYVALYALGTEAKGYKAGIVRFLNVFESPPRRGRPLIGATLSLTEMVEEIVAKATGMDGVTWVEPEPD